MAKVQVDSSLCNQGCRKNGAFTFQDTLPTVLVQFPSWGFVSVVAFLIKAVYHNIISAFDGFEQGGSKFIWEKLKTDEGNLLLWELLSDCRFV